jgi:hypothetical protein
MLLTIVRRCTTFLVEILFFGGRKGLENADEALRYLPIAEEILHGGEGEPRILEVGSGVKGITPYVPFKVTGVDVAFNGEVAANLDPVCLSGTELPFPDQSYDYVVSVDMLEHVASGQRTAVISELLRVAGRRVFLAVPCGEQAEIHDREMDELFVRVRKSRDRFLREHVEHGLPTKDELESRINEVAARLGRRITIRVVPNVNLKVRRFFMKLCIVPRYERMFSLLSPFLCIIRNFLNSGDCYRQMFVIEIGADD